MDKVILNDGPVRIAIERQGDSAALVMEQEREVRFRLSRMLVAAILAGETVQFSLSGIFCKLARDNGLLNATYAWHGIPDIASAEISHLEKLLAALDNP